MKLKLNITFKLVGYLVIVSVLPLFVFALISYDVERETVLDLTAQYSSQLVANQRDYLQQQVIDQIENLASRIASSEEISAILIKSNSFGKKQRNTYDEFSTQAELRDDLSLYSNQKGITSIDLFSVSGLQFFVGETLNVPAVNDTVRNEIFHQALNSPKNILWLGVVNNLNPASKSVMVLTAVKIISHFSAQSHKSEPIGMLLINCSTDYLSEHFSQVDLGANSYVLITDDKGRLVYSPERMQIGQTIPTDFKSQSISAGGSRLLLIQGKPYLVSVAEIESLHWKIWGVIPQQTLLTPMKRLTQIFALLLLLSVAVIILTSQIFRRNMVVPIQAISDGFKRIYDKNNDKDKPLPVPSTHDEISELVVWYNAFLDTQKIRLKYEQDLLDGQHKFATIFNQAPLPLVLIRFETWEFVDMNDFWLDQFEYTREEVIGHTPDEINLWVERDDRYSMTKLIQGVEVVNRFESRQRTKSGRQLSCLISGRPVRFQDELFYLFSSVDISRQREAEREIQEINLQLESRVLSRTAQLQKTNAELNATLENLNMARAELVRTEKLASLGSLVAGVAHEINTPVGIIVTSASILAESSAEVQLHVNEGNMRKSTMLEYVRVALESSRLILANANRAARLIQSFKQVAVDQTSEQRREFELAEFIQEIVTSLNPTLRKAQTTIELVSAGDPIYMDSYPGLLAQVLTNLTMNSVTHAFKDQPNGHIRIETELIDDMASIYFSDNGCGIPETIIDKIFDPFFTTRRGQGGTGLGLNIVFNIINQQFGGSITVHNRPEGGALFKLLIPRACKK